jgi:hypothetical protein
MSTTGEKPGAGSYSKPNKPARRSGCLTSEQIKKVSEEIAQAVVRTLDDFKVAGGGPSGYDCSGSENFVCGVTYDCINSFILNPGGDDDNCPEFTCQGHFQCSGFFQG